MGRKRWIYTNKGQPLPHPIEIEVDDKKPAPDVRPVLPVPEQDVVTRKTPANAEGGITSAGMWSEFPLPGEK